MLTYKNYLENKDHLSFADAVKIYDAINSYSKFHDADFDELFMEAIVAANQYANIRANWSIASPAEKRAVDQKRTEHHNAFMSALQILTRYMEQQGWNTDLVNSLGTPQANRKRFGDFACYLVCINAINAR